MQRTFLLLVSTLFLGLASCSENGNGQDAGVSDGSTDQDGNVGGDGASGADLGPPDSGPPPCNRDQDCDPGEICNLALDPPQCVPGVSCTSNVDCARCGDPTKTPAERDCGHGFEVFAFCDLNRGSVCTRQLTSCEACTSDDECARLPNFLGSNPGKCIEYEPGKKFCGRAATAGCPVGFVADIDGFCRRAAGCDDEGVVVCPPGDPAQLCTRKDQICYQAECPGTGGAQCTGNDLPGHLGTCVGFCDDNSDCPSTLPVCNTLNGVCIPGCDKDTCAGGLTCHSDGFCGPPCDDNDNCATRFGQNTYCNQRTQVQAPRYFKNYHDEFSCQELGCEQAQDCSAAGVVCDLGATPPACVPGCYTRDDCLSGEICRDPGAAGPQPNYNRAQCRALAEKATEQDIGVCCNPGCTDRDLHCDINQWCCGEEGSPFESGGCGTVDDGMSAPHTAEAGECFDIAPPPTSPFCTQCMGPEDCNSGWTAGFNVDPNINGGAPFQEQEMCFGIAQNLGMCAVTCNPNAADSACPRGWSCTGFFPPCLQDADCNGLTCDGANTTVNPPIPGRCQCGENGVATTACPQSYAQLPQGFAVQNPRCVAQGAAGKLYCLAAWLCNPPNLSQNPQTQEYNYPDACLQ